jgi:hypothetical protein
MHPNIKMTPRNGLREDHIRFEFKCATNHISWECITSIADWLSQNDIVYMVHSFQCGQMAIDVPSPEDRTLIYLTFPTKSYDPESFPF